MLRRIALLSTSLLVAATLGTSVSAGASTAQVFPSVSGTFDHSPTVTFPKGAPPSQLEVKVLHKGTGTTVHKADLLVVNYVGQIWNGKVFDSSFGRQLFGVPIGVGQVIPGWDKTLVGERVGSRVLLVLPPTDAYPKGNTGAGIKATDVIVFVVDLVATYTKSVKGDVHATPLSNTVKGVTVGGTLGGTPTITVAKGTPDPKTTVVELLDRGHGTDVKPGLVVLQTLVSNWAGKVQASTWALGTPDAETVGSKSAPSALDALVGKPIGSRLLVEIPKNGTNGPYAVALVIVAQPHGTSSQPS